MRESEIIFTVIDSPEGGFEARALGHPIFTQADTLDELKEMLRDAVRCHFEDRQRVDRRIDQKRKIHQCLAIFARN
jgi:hypothetical protein